MDELDLDFESLFGIQFTPQNVPDEFEIDTSALDAVKKKLILVDELIVKFKETLAEVAELKREKIYYLEEINKYRQTLMTNLKNSETWEKKYNELQPKVARLEQELSCNENLVAARDSVIRQYSSLVKDKEIEITQLNDKINSLKSIEIKSKWELKWKEKYFKVLKSSKKIRNSFKKFQNCKECKKLHNVDKILRTFEEEENCFSPASEIPPSISSVDTGFESPHTLSDSDSENELSSLNRTSVKRNASTAESVPDTIPYYYNAAEQFTTKNSVEKCGEEVATKNCVEKYGNQGHFNNNNIEFSINVLDFEPLAKSNSGEKLERCSQCAAGLKENVHKCVQTDINQTVDVSVSVSCEKLEKNVDKYVQTEKNPSVDIALSVNSEESKENVHKYVQTDKKQGVDVSVSVNHAELKEIVHKCVQTDKIQEGDSSLTINCDMLPKSMQTDCVSSFLEENTHIRHEKLYLVNESQRTFVEHSDNNTLKVADTCPTDILIEDQGFNCNLEDAAMSSAKDDIDSVSTTSSSLEDNDLETNKGMEEYLEGNDLVEWNVSLYSPVPQLLSPLPSSPSPVSSEQNSNMSEPESDLDITLSYEECKNQKASSSTIWPKLVDAEVQTVLPINSCQERRRVSVDACTQASDSKEILKNSDFVSSIPCNKYARKHSGINKSVQESTREVDSEVLKMIALQFLCNSTPNNNNFLTQVLRKEFSSFFDLKFPSPHSTSLKLLESSRKGFNHLPVNNYVKLESMSDNGEVKPITVTMDEKSSNESRLGFHKRLQGIMSNYHAGRITERKSREEYTEKSMKFNVKKLKNVTKYSRRRTFRTTKLRSIVAKQLSYSQSGAFVVSPVEKLISSNLECGSEKCVEYTLHTKQKDTENSSDRCKCCKNDSSICSNILIQNSAIRSNITSNGTHILNGCSENTFLEQNRSPAFRSRFSSEVNFSVANVSMNKSTSETKEKTQSNISHKSVRKSGGNVDDSVSRYDSNRSDLGVLTNEILYEKCLDNSPGSNRLNADAPENQGLSFRALNSFSQCTISMNDTDTFNKNLRDSVISTPCKSQLEKKGSTENFQKSSCKRKSNKINIRNSTRNIIFHENGAHNSASNETDDSAPKSVHKTGYSQNLSVHCGNIIVQSDYCYESFEKNRVLESNSLGPKTSLMHSQANDKNKAETPSANSNYLSMECNNGIFHTLNTNDSESIAQSDSSSSSLKLHSASSYEEVENLKQSKSDPFYKRKQDSNHVFQKHCENDKNNERADTLLSVGNKTMKRKNIIEHPIPSLAVKKKKVENKRNEDSERSPLGGDNLPTAQLVNPGDIFNNSCGERRRSGRIQSICSKNQKSPLSNFSLNSNEEYNNINSILNEKHGPQPTHHNTEISTRLLKRKTLQSALSNCEQPAQCLGNNSSSNVKSKNSKCLEVITNHKVTPPSCGVLLRSNSVSSVVANEETFAVCGSKPFRETEERSPKSNQKICTQKKCDENNSLHSNLGPKFSPSTNIKNVKRSKCVTKTVKKSGLQKFRDKCSKLQKCAVAMPEERILTKLQIFSQRGMTHGQSNVTELNSTKLTGECDTSEGTLSDSTSVGQQQQESLLEEVLNSRCETESNSVDMESDVRNTYPGITRETSHVLTEDLTLSDSDETSHSLSENDTSGDETTPLSCFKLNTAKCTNNNQESAKLLSGNNIASHLLSKQEIQPSSLILAKESVEKSTYKRKTEKEGCANNNVAKTFSYSSSESESEEESNNCSYGSFNSIASSKSKGHPCSTNVHVSVAVENNCEGTQVINSVDGAVHIQNSDASLGELHFDLSCKQFINSDYIKENNNNNSLGSEEVNEVEELESPLSPDPEDSPLSTDELCRNIPSSPVAIDKVHSVYDDVTTFEEGGSSSSPKFERSAMNNDSGDGIVNSQADSPTRTYLTRSRLRSMSGGITDSGRNKIPENSLLNRYFTCYYTGKLKKPTIPSGALKLKEKVEKNIQSVLDNFVNCDCTDSVFTDTVDICKKISKDHFGILVRCIVRCVKHTSNGVYDYSNPNAAPLTMQQKSILALTIKLEEYHPTLVVDVLKRIHFIVCDFNHHHFESTLFCLARFFLAFCKLRNDKKLLQVFLYDSLYSLKLRGYGVLHAVITGFADVFPKAGDDAQGSLLVKTIVFIVYTYGKSSFIKTSQIRGFFSNHYGFKREMLPRIEEFLKLFVTEIKKGTNLEVEQSVLLLSKFQSDWEWTFNKLIKGCLLPIVDSWKLGNASENAALMSLKLIGYLAHTPPYERDDVVGLLKIFGNMISSNTCPPSIKEVCINAVVPLTYINEHKVFDILRNCKSDEYLENSESVKETLNLVFQKRTNKWWKNYLKLTKQQEPLVEKIQRNIKKK